MARSSVTVFYSGENPKKKETIKNVVSVSENEHSFSVYSVKPKNKQIFSKPEYCYAVCEDDWA